MIDAQPENIPGPLYCHSSHLSHSTLRFLLSNLAGGVSINSGKALSNNLNSMVYDIFYSLEAGYYIVVAIFSLTICTILILAELIFPSRTFLKMTGLYMLLLLLACFQFSMAICSAINATVVADQSYLFDRAGYIGRFDDMQTAI